MKCHFSFFLASAGLGWAAPSFATPPSSTTSAEETSQGEVIARARALFGEGLGALKAGHLHAARKAMRESFELRPAYDVAGQLGQLELELGDYPSAAEHIDFCLRNFPTGGKQELLREVRSAFSSVKKRVGTVRVAVDRAGVEVLLDGRSVGPSPVGRDLFVSPGEHRVQVRAEDGSVVEERFQIAAGESKPLELITREPLVPSAPATAVGTDRGARGAPLGPDDSPAPRSWLPAYVAGGVSAAALVTSVVFRASRRSDAREIDRLEGSVAGGSCASGGAQPPECQQLAGAVERYDSKGTGADVSLAVGGAAAAVAIGYVLYVWLDEPTPQTGVRASAGFDGASGGLFLTGSF